MENFKTLIDILLVVGAGAGAWFLMKYQVKELIKTQEAMFKKLDLINEKVVLAEQDMVALKKEAQKFENFKKKITVLEQETSHHIDLISAEERFVTRKEFDLIIKGIEKDMKELKEGQHKILNFLERQAKKND